MQTRNEPWGYVLGLVMLSTVASTAYAAKTSDVTAPGMQAGGTTSTAGTSMGGAGVAGGPGTGGNPGTAGRAR